MCKECYVDNSRITPLLNPFDCLENHTQYICGDNEDLQVYLRKNKDKICETMSPIFRVEEYNEYSNTQVRKLTFDEIQKYMSEREI